MWMKSYFAPMKHLIAFTLMVAALGVQAQKVETSFRVEGICGMCEERIEGALDVRGVISAEWDRESKMLTVVYEEKQISEAALHDLIHAVGHDTSAGKATDEEYAGLHGCCKYREGASCTKHE